MFENITTTDLIMVVVTFVAGLLIGTVIYHVNLIRLKSSVKSLKEKSHKEAEKIKKEKLYNFIVEMQQRRSRLQNELRQKEEKINKQEGQLAHREKQLRKEDNQIHIAQSRLESKENKINELEEILFEKHKKLDSVIEDQNTKLERLSHISQDEAKKILLKNLDAKVKIEAAQMANDIRTEAKERAQKEAKEIIATAIENLSYEFTMESTLSNVELPNERFKGMIIGREGKNIRAFEDATGVKVIVDDTPETVVMSGFDPVAREVARVAMQNLIKTKNININNIQHAVKKAKNEVNKSISKAAEETLRELRLNNVHPLMKENRGRLRYRYS